MTGVTITLGTIGAAISVFCWYFFLSGVLKITRTILQGQPAPKRFTPIIPRLKTLLIEFAAHTRMAKFRTVGWAHWLVMFGFLLGAAVWFEAYGQSFDPDFSWPIIGRLHTWIFIDELLGLGTTLGITVLIIIRQLNHPRIPERLSRFGGSNFTAAYFVEFVVLLEGLGMLFVKTFKIASGMENPPLWTSFFTKNLAHLFMGIAPICVCLAALVKLLSGMIWLAVVGHKITWGVAWHRFSAFINIYAKREANGDVALGAVKPMTSGGKAIDLETADPDVDTFGAGKIEDFSWKALLDFTTCTECGRCQSQCPAWNTGKPLSPKLLIMGLRDHAYSKAPYLLAGGKKDISGKEIGLIDATGNALPIVNTFSPEIIEESTKPLISTDSVLGVLDPDVLWSCTTCGACVQQCPVDIEHVDHIIDIRRYQVLIESEFPHELGGLFKNLETKGNPWGQNSSTRNNWINEVNFPVPVWGKDINSFTDFEYLFWVGCAGAFEDRAKKTTKAVAELLHIADIEFLVLGDGETCTGDSARRAGNELLFQTLAQENIATLDTIFDGLAPIQRKIVVTCAHCFNTLSNEYPQLGAHYEVVHHTQLLNRLVREKRLIPVAQNTENVTYHDPCYLGRHNKIYQAPRELISASGATLKEMPRHGERSMCCGAGGARMWMEEQLGKRINVDRVDEALLTNPQTIATGCPFCQVMLTDGVTSQVLEGDPAVEVVDVAQMLLESVKRGLPKTWSKEKTSKDSSIKSDNLAADESVASKSTYTEPASKTSADVAPESPDNATENNATALAAVKKKPTVGLAVTSGKRKPGGDVSAVGDNSGTSTPPTSTVKQAGLGLKTGVKKPGQSKSQGKSMHFSGTAVENAVESTVTPTLKQQVTQAPEQTQLQPDSVKSSSAVLVKGLPLSARAKRPGSGRS